MCLRLCCFGECVCVYLCNTRYIYTPIKSAVSSLSLGSIQHSTEGSEPC